MLRTLWYKLRHSKSQLAEQLAWESVEGSSVAIVESGKYQFHVSPVINWKQKLTDPVCFVVYLGDTMIQIEPVEGKTDIQIEGYFTIDGPPTTLRFALESSLLSNVSVLADVTWNATYRSVVEP